MRTIVALVTISALFAGCKKERPAEETPSASATAPSDPAADQAAAGETATAKPADGFGSLSGKVTLEGDAPKMPELDRKSDPVCAKDKKNAPWVLNNGGLHHVVVRLPVGAVKGDAPAEPVVIDQNQCMYEPYVTGVVSGQKVSIKNSDKTTHNVHTYVGDETIFNEAQPPGAPEIEKEIEEDAGSVMKFTCDVHKWMAAHVVITDHPYFGVTGADGSFKLDKVPAGDFEVEAWHPHLGMQKMKVNIPKDGAGVANFTFKAADFKAPS